MAVAHYLEALEWQKEMVKVHTVFGGKNPHPNYLVGGAPCSFNLDENNAINAERLAFVGKLFEDGKQFIEQVYIPDLLAVASFYKDWGAIGGGLTNYMAYGDLPTHGYGDPAHVQVPARRHPEPQPGRGAAGRRQGSRSRSRSRSPTPGTSTRDGDGAAKHPWDGETKLNYTGPEAAVRAARRRSRSTAG